MREDFLKAKLHPRNVYSFNCMIDFVLLLIAPYNERFPETTPFLRTPLYELCETESVSYIVHLKSNAILQRNTDEMHPATSSDITTAEYHFKTTEYQAKSQTKPRTVIIQSVRSTNEMFSCIHFSSQ